ncbi:MAG: ATP/GTP-binding protein [Gammaproteobacteria bacterium]|nr:ATP/GTP-binding protein [Gammaproteobacteria bacterium]
MAREDKIIFAGPVGAGKTAAIAAVSDVELVKTEALATDEVALRKLNTTVAMDYGALHLEDGSKIHLYGTPGQDRFDFMWEILTIGGIGLVLFIDNARENPIADLEHYLNAFKKFIARTDVVIGVTRTDVKAEPRLEAYNAKIREMGLKVPVFQVDARRREDVKVMLLALLAMLDPGLKR